MPNKPDKQEPANPTGDLNSLVDAIQLVHEQSAAVVNRAVNTSLTLRNWVIGTYIREYEQQGADRATYGEALLERLSERLTAIALKGFSARYLRLCRQFSSVYPEIWRTLTAESSISTLPESIRRTLTAKSSSLQDSSSKTAQLTGNLEAPHDSNPIVPTASLPFDSPSEFPIETLLGSLSYSHFEQLIALDEPLKRAFYEIESIRGNWSVRALKRQIASLYFERSGLSLDKEKLSAMANELAETAEPNLSIRDPYIFEFLGLKPHETMAESDLEEGLLKNLQEFLLELGHGFCLEARQKSIVIGGTRGFVDIVFYHRILKCHVLVELKVDEFRHEHIGQLNTYVAWFEKNMMQEGDNPPIGLLLCTGKDHALVEYALSSMSKRLFVSKYQLELPSKEDLREFIDSKRKEVNGEI